MPFSTMYTMASLKHCGSNGKFPCATSYAISRHKVSSLFIGINHKKMIQSASEMHSHRQSVRCGLSQFGIGSLKAGDVMNNPFRWHEGERTLSDFVIGLVQMTDPNCLKTISESLSLALSASRGVSMHMLVTTVGSCQKEEMLDRHVQGELPAERCPCFDISMDLPYSAASCKWRVCVLFP